MDEAGPMGREDLFRRIADEAAAAEAGRPDVVALLRSAASLDPGFTHYPMETEPDAGFVV